MDVRLLKPVFLRQTGDGSRRRTDAWFGERVKLQANV